MSKMKVKFYGHKITRKHCYISLVAIFVIFILDQVYYYLRITSSGTRFPRYLHIDDVRQLLKASEDSDVIVMLFDPLILRAWDNNPHIIPPGECIFLCHVIGPLTFMVKETEVRKKPFFLSRLAQLGFTVTQFFSNSNKSHIFLMRHGSPIHLTVLHWSNAGYWRQYALSGSPHEMRVVKQFITKESWNYMNVDRAYENFETSIVVIDGLQLTAPKDIYRFANDHQNAIFIPCNITRANYFYLKHPRDNSQRAISAKHKASKLLAKTKSLLDYLDIPFWLTGGTFLGFLRQCDTIPWSLSLNLGIFIENYSANLIGALEQKGLKLRHKFGKPDDSFELAFEDTGIRLNVSFFYTEGASIWNGATQPETRRKFKYVYPLFGLCWTEFYEVKVRIPCQTEDYIKAAFGSTWFEPVSSWDLWRDPPNLRDNGEWNRNMLDQVVVVKGVGFIHT